MTKSYLLGSVTTGKCIACKDLDHLKKMFEGFCIAKLTAKPAENLADISTSLKSLMEELSVREVDSDKDFDNISGETYITSYFAILLRNDGAGFEIVSIDELEKGNSDETDIDPDATT